MGSSPSRPAYAFPVPMPAHDPPLRSKSGKWSLSMRRKSKHDKDREKYDDFIFPKYPTVATATYGYPYCASPSVWAVLVLTECRRPTDAIRLSYILCPGADGGRAALWDSTACPCHAPDVRPDGGIPNRCSPRPTRHRTSTHASHANASTRICTSRTNARPCPSTRARALTSNANARSCLSTR